LSVPPPSKPDRRISRIRLSSRWFTSERIDRSQPERYGETPRAEPEPHQRFGTPEGVVNMASQVIVGARPVALATKVPAGLARRHLDRCRLRRFPLSSSTFLRSLRSRPVTALRRSYGRSDSCSSALFSALPGRRGWLLDEQVSLIHALGLPTILSPNTCGCCASPRHVTCRRVAPRKLPHGNTPNGNSGLRHTTQARPITPAESSLDFSHARERSYGLVVHLRWLPTPSHDDAVIFSYRFTLNPERTSTSPAKCALRRT